MAITTVSRVPFGKLPAATEIEPRASVISPLPQALATAAQREQQAAVTEFRAASTLGDVSRELADIGRAFLKPTDDLIQSRKQLQANDISIRFIRESQRRADFAKTDGTPFTQYAERVDAEHVRLSQSATEEARGLGGAAVAQVGEDMAKERMRRMAESRQYVLEQDANDQLGMLARFGQYAREEVLKLPEDQIVDFMGRYDRTYNAAVTRGLLKADAVQREKQDFYWYALRNRGLQLARSDGFFAARDYWKKFNLPGDQTRVFEDNAHSLLNYDNTQAAEAERKQAKIHREAQKTTSNGMLLTIVDPNVKDHQLIALEQQAFVMSQDGRLYGEDAENLIKYSKNRRDELLRPIPVIEVPENINALTLAIGEAPEGVTPEMIFRMPGLKPETRNEFTKWLLSRIDKNHFTNNDFYQRHLAELDAIAAHEAPEPFNAASAFGTPGAQPLPVTLRQRVNDYKTAYIRAVAEDSKGRQYTAKNHDIAKFDGLIERYKQELRDPNRKQPAPAGGSTALFDSLRAIPLERQGPPQ